MPLLDKKDNNTGKGKSKKPSSGPKMVHDWKVWVDRDLCIGAASCIAVAPKAFDLDNEAKAVIVDSADEESKETILDAAKVCPVAAIIIEAKDGKKIYPK